MVWMTVILSKSCDLINGLDLHLMVEHKTLWFECSDCMRQKYVPFLSAPRTIAHF